MAAGQGFKTFATGDVLSAADVNGYLMQGVLVFADSAERDAEITSPEEGQFAYLKDTNVTTYYTGSTWANLDTTGMTNPMTTTGDVIYSSSGSTPARLGIGTAGQVLQVNSGATAPEWATVSTSPTFAGCLLTNAASQSIAYNTVTALTFDTERIDTDAYHSTSTNTSRITIPAGKAGKYLITWRVTWAYNTSGDRAYYLYKNGTILDAGYGGASTSTVVQQQQVTIATLAENDYLEVFVLQSIAAATALSVFCDSQLGIPGITQFGVEYLGA